MKKHGLFFLLWCAIISYAQTPAESDSLQLDEELQLKDIVITGTMKAVTKLDSPVPVEVYDKVFFQSNPTPSVFEALQNVNGVRPQVNCSVCNTGDIHINGLEGPYTMVLVDGMPIVSGLSTVYGLSGIPQALIERVEVVKGPASSLYGSEAVGGLINVITKNSLTAPTFTAEAYGTSWQEYNLDLGTKINAGKNVSSILGVNYFNYQNPVDNNKDNFTDITLQHRISVFNKWDIQRKNNRIFNFAARYNYEDRWGGDMKWKPKYRGGEDVYGESIFTSRWEMFGNYQLPMDEKVILQFSANGHDQNSVYGSDQYIADQRIGFAQLVWDKPTKNHDLLFGLSYRYTYYDDNTPATANFNDPNKNEPTHTHLPGIFIQDEITLSENNKLLAGMRYDYNSIHGNIFTPRLNYKWNSNDKNDVIRLSLGNGYRVANVFTEDHAALTGSREVVFADNLKPETSWNANINYVKKLYSDSGTHVSFDFTGFYTYFNNKIIPDYDTNSTQIIYDNLKGYAVSKGVSLNMDFVFPFGLKLLTGATLMDVYSVEDKKKEREYFSENFTTTWTAAYTIRDWGLTIDYTGNLYSPMKLPLLSSVINDGEEPVVRDPRRAESPWFSIQNIQFTKKFSSDFEVFAGVKNLLNWTPDNNAIARTHDPFDENVVFDSNDNVVVTPENPHGLVFDPSYVYASNQGIRAFIGLRFKIK